MAASSKVRPFKKLLRDISNGLGEDEVVTIICLLMGDHLKKRDEKQYTDALSIFCDLEKNGAISATNLDLLEDILSEHPLLLEKVQAFKKAQQDTCMLVHVGFDWNLIEQQMISTLKELRKEHEERGLDPETSERQIQLRQHEYYETIIMMKVQAKRNADCLEDGEVVDICEAYAYNRAKKIRRGCLELTLNFATLFNLRQFEGSCRSGKLAKAFEPLLISDDVRNKAEEAGLRLQLLASYNQDRFTTVRQFFLKRDGGTPIEIETNCDEPFGSMVDESNYGTSREDSMNQSLVSAEQDAITDALKFDEESHDSLTLHDEPDCSAEDSMNPPLVSTAQGVINDALKIESLGEVDDAESDENIA